MGKQELFVGVGRLWNSDERLGVPFIPYLPGVGQSPYRNLKFRVARQIQRFLRWAEYIHVHNGS